MLFSHAVETFFLHFIQKIVAEVHSNVMFIVKHPKQKTPKLVCFSNYIIYFLMLRVGFQYLHIAMPVTRRVIHIWRIGEHIRAVNVIDRFNFRKCCQILVVKKLIAKFCLRKEGRNKASIRKRKNVVVILRSCILNKIF